MGDEERQELVGHINWISDIDPKKYVRTKELGEQLDFREAVPILENIRSLFLRLVGADFHLVGDSQENRLLSAARSVRQTLDEVLAFDAAADADPRGRREQLVGSLSHGHENALQAGGPVITLSFAWVGGRDVDEMRREAREVSDEMKARIESHESEIKKRTQEAERLVSLLKDRAAEEGVAEHARLFETAASEFSDEKKKWLKWSKWTAIAGGLLAVGNVIAVFATSWNPAFAVEVEEAIQIAVAKLVLFGLVYGVLVWLVRMYRAAAHNEVVNRHRFRAMRSFEKFVAATKDDQTKQAVLLRATESIFVHQSSGLSAEPGRDMGGSQWLEIIRGISPAAGDSK